MRDIADAVNNRLAIAGPADRIALLLERGKPWPAEQLRELRRRWGGDADWGGDAEWFSFEGFTPDPAAEPGTSPRVPGCSGDRFPFGRVDHTCGGLLELLVWADAGWRANAVIHFDTAWSPAEAEPAITALAEQFRSLSLEHLWCSGRPGGPLGARLISGGRDETVSLEPSADYWNDEVSIDAFRNFAVLRPGTAPCCL
jgi:hypothetical protein